MSDEWEGRLVGFGDEDDETGVLYFDPRCPNCRRFIKFPKSIKVRTINGVAENVWCKCSRCGEVEPDSVGYI